MPQRGLSRCAGYQPPTIQILRVLAGIALTRRVQGEGFSRDCFPGDDEGLFTRGVARFHCQTDKDVCVTLAEFAMMMEVEVPRPITVRVAAVADGYVVSTQTWKGHPQRDPDAVVDQQIVSLDRGDGPYGKSQATQTFRNAPFRQEMFLYPIHVSLTLFAVIIFEGRNVLTLFGQLARVCRCAGVAQLARAYACQA